MKFKTNHSQYFKEWICSSVRILNDRSDKGFYRYEVQKHNGTTWDRVRCLHTLAEAKEAALWVLDDMKSDLARMQ